MSLFENIISSSSSEPGNGEMKPARVLAVEDDRHGQHAIQRVLERAGYRVRVVTNVQAALDALSESEFDLVLSDFRLPGGDGLDLLARAHDLRPDTPFLFLSGETDSEVKRRASEMGAYAFIEKPVSVSQLFEAMKRALQR